MYLSLLVQCSWGKWLDPRHNECPRKRQLLFIYVRYWQREPNWSHNDPMNIKRVNQIGAKTGKAADTGKSGMTFAI